MTDKWRQDALLDERIANQKLIRDQRDANEQLVRATLRAHERTDEAEAAKVRAEASERELRALAEFREMFIGIVGHDLRNPLGAIVMGAAAMLRRGNLDEHDARTAARIINSSQRMTRIIAQLLDFTHARLGGGLPLEPKPTDLAQVCQSLIEEFEGRREIQLEVEGDLAGTWDADRLAEALSNILGNAVEHALPGTPINISARAAGADVVVEISNQGPPIPEHVLPVIFEPFRRGRQGEKSEGGNLGLGLYIANQIVHSHSGTIEARSAGGTTMFAMRLPRRFVPAPS